MPIESGYLKSCRTNRLLQRKSRCIRPSLSDMRGNLIGLKKHWGKVSQPAMRRPPEPSETLSTRSLCSAIHDGGCQFRLWLRWLDRNIQFERRGRKRRHLCSVKSDSTTGSSLPIRSNGLTGFFSNRFNCRSLQVRGWEAEQRGSRPRGRKPRRRSTPRAGSQPCCQSPD